VHMMNAVDYVGIDDRGLHLTVGDQPQTLDVDTIIICAGQESLRTLYDELQACGASVDLVGGAKEAAELDAKAAINQASYLAAAI
jgi:2,4-dienoyl-CoA reductase (NADPH2)